MCAQELIAMFRYSKCTCKVCQRIVSRYEKTLILTPDDMRHLEKCIFE
ncbi:MAG: hypothetical protein BWY02_02857 [bacterium ADurb.Bin157]|nr:hypothetical protein [Candidatus Riflebacteria bacterium]OQB44149.1 MAG: hypothetical protein BWY02_02857 [bacterium ADurb.Bin157]